MKLTGLFNDFFRSEKTGGFLLLGATVISILLANSPWQTAYLEFWHTKTGDHDLVHWINEGLMTIFFLLIGLELEREIYKGELSELRNAALPFAGALGGMLVPAALYLLFNLQGSYLSGAGIPMATDIAFAIGILSLLGKRVPSSLKVFLTALAVSDDLGAIIIIAIFYTGSLSVINLLIALAVFAILLLLNRLKVHNLIPYFIGGAVMWYFMTLSGVHATITGVLLAFAIPFGDGGKKSPSYGLQRFLHHPVAYIILPLFAMANTCIPISDGWQRGLMDSYSLGIMAGLIAGKPVGIFFFALTASLLGICTLPRGLKWKHIFGAGVLAGIGFTMSIFITLLAFDDAEVINNAKIAILLASVAAGLAGLVFLRMTLKKKSGLQT